MSETAGLSYSHLSRIENDSTLPGPKTIAKLVDVLGGDVKRMLEMAECLPEIILERIQGHGEPSPARLHRTAGSDNRGADREQVAALLEFARSAGLGEEAAAELASATAALAQLPAHQRRSIALMIHSISQEGNERPG